MNKGRLFIKYFWIKWINCIILEVWEVLSYFFNLIFEVFICICIRLYVYNDKKVILVVMYNMLGYYVSYV